MNLPPDAKSPLRIRALFAGIADRYDLANDLLSLGIHRAWKARAIRECGGLSGLRVLDAATGTGDLAIRCAKAGAAQVVGIDLSDEMLRHARIKARDAGTEGLIEFTRSDLVQSGLPDASFDRVMIAFGIRNVEEPKKGLDALWKLLRPGGRLIILEFGDWGARGGGLKRLFLGYAKIALERIGGIITGQRSAYTYLMQSSLEFPGADGFGLWLRELPGSQPPRTISLFGGVAFLYRLDKVLEGAKQGSKLEQVPYRLS